MLKSGKLNNRLFCELITHPEFPRLMANMEIYVDGMVSMQIRNLNALLESVRTSIIEKYDPKEDNTLRTLKAAQIDEDEYFARIVSNDVEQILTDIKQRHSKDASSASVEFPLAEFKESLEKISQVKGSKVEKLMMLFCKQNQINYSKLTDNEKHWLVEICKKSNLLKGGPAREENAQRNRTATAAGLVYLCSAEDKKAGRRVQLAPSVSLYFCWFAIARKGGCAKREIL